jgi:hypothetical protein
LEEKYLGGHGSKMSRRATEEEEEEEGLMKFGIPRNSTESFPVNVC